MRELETGRLMLRELTRRDTRAIFENWARDPEVSKYMTWTAHRDVSVTERIVEHWLEEYEKPGCYRYIIELKGYTLPIGMIDVVEYRDGVPVVGYCSGRRFWGNGYMTEALGAVKEELFADGYDTIIIEAVAENIGSNRVIQKCGGELVSSEKKPLSDIKNEPVTVNSYRIRKDG
ncbi:MAG: GNAT family N-acetyltransferase [Ruminiclostridium sp.]|nr:GNAT family N-acetyltransferase [Ruminiclostridium sp.]